MFPVFPVCELEYIHLVSLVFGLLFGQIRLLKMWPWALRIPYFLTSLIIDDSPSSSPTGRWILSAGALNPGSKTFTLRYNYHVFYDILSFLQLLFSVEATEPSLHGSTPPTPLSFSLPSSSSFSPSSSLLSAVLRADISQHDKSRNLQGGKPAAILVSKRERERDGGEGWEESERDVQRCNHPQWPR